MNKNINISENALNELFKKIHLDDPTPDFMENLLQRIEKESVASEKMKQFWMIAGQIAAGVSGIILLPALAIYLCTIYLPGFSFTFPKINLNFDINLITIGFSVLMLLIIDTLLRTHAANRTKNDSL